MMNDQPPQQLRFFPVLLVFNEIANYLSNDMVLPALPSMMAAFQTTHAHIQSSISWWFLGSLMSQLILGPVADRFGRRTILFSCSIIYIITCLICAYTVDIQVLLATRFIQGTVISASFVIGYASIHETYDDKRAVHVIAWMGAIVILAPGLGPVIGGILLHFTSWRVIFLLMASMATLSLIGLYFTMPQSDHRDSLSVREMAPKLWQVFTTPGFNTNSSLVACLVSVLVAWITAAPLLLIGHYHYSPSHFGLIQAIVFSGTMISAHAIKPLMRKFKANSIVNAGLVGSVIAGNSTVIAILFFPVSPLPLIAGYTAFALCEGLCFSILQRAAISASNAPSGIKMAAFSTCLSIGATSGSFLAAHSLSATPLPLAIILAIGSAVALLFKWTIAQPVELQS